MGKIMEETNMARFGRLLGLLLSSGVPLLEGLRLINDSFTNRLYQRGIQVVAEQVERGIPMSTPINDNPVFPLMVGQMVAVGEQTGKMDEVMVKLAEYYETEVDAKVAGLSSLIEPMVIILLGIGVAWLVIAVLLPIYQISTSIS
jgi:type IV pilus assembly protein PilC